MPSKSFQQALSSSSSNDAVEEKVKAKARLITHHGDDIDIF